MTLATTKETPRIYVASLSDYNAGTLHGVWIDVDKHTTADDIHMEVEGMLKDSPENKLCQWCGSPVTEHLIFVDGVNSHNHDPLPGNAEEWAIHDYDGFGGLNLGEWESFDRIAELGAAIEEHGVDAVAAFVNYDDSVDLADISDRLLGEWESVEHYAEEFYSGIDLGPLADYIDFDRIGRDWVDNGDIIAVHLGWQRVLLLTGN